MTEILSLLWTMFRAASVASTASVIACAKTETVVKNTIKARQSIRIGFMSVLNQKIGATKKHRRYKNDYSGISIL